MSADGAGSMPSMKAPALIIRQPSRRMGARVAFVAERGGHVDDMMVADVDGRALKVISEGEESRPAATLVTGRHASPLRPVAPLRHAVG